MNELSHLDNFEDSQLLNLVNNTIVSKTEFKIKDFTGGSLQITSTNNHTITNYKVSLFFGYKSKKAVSRTITITKDMFYIWAKALILKCMSIENDNLGMNYSELNKLMNSDLTSSSISNKVKNSIVGVDLPVDLPDETDWDKINNNLLNKQIKKDKENTRLEELAHQIPCNTARLDIDMQKNNSSHSTHNFVKQNSCQIDEIEF